MSDTLNLDPNADDQKLLAQVVAYYHQALKNTPEAQEYLRKRGITHPTMAAYFRLGYSDRTLGLQLPSKDSRAGQAIRARLQRLGVFRASGHEHLRGSITVPIPAADGTGAIADIYGRKILDGHLRKGTAYHTNLNDNHPGVFNVQALGATEEIILTASIWDSLTLWNYGYRNTTCMFGPVGLTADLLGAFSEFNIRRVLTTSETVVEKLLAAGLEVFLVRLPVDQDINRYARQTQDPANALGALLRHAEWVGRGKPPSAPVVAPTAPPEPENGPQDGHQGNEEAVVGEQGDPLADLLDADDPEGDPAAALAELLDADDEDEEGDPAERLEENGPDEDGTGGGQEGNDPGGVEGNQEPGAIDPVTRADPPVRSASPVPTIPPQDEVAVTGNEVALVFGTRRYRIRGLDKNTTSATLRVNVLASNGVGMFVDTFDLYSAKHRTGFIEQAAVEMNVEPATVKQDVGRVLLKLEELQDNALNQTKTQTHYPEITGRDREDALAFLRDPKLLDRIVDDLPVVGERANKLVGYLAAVSRKLDSPLAVLIQSTSAAGKTTLMEAVLDLCPPEDVVKFSAMTGQSLYYMPPDALRHKILALVEEEGASRASYALKLLQSEGELRIASTGKDAGTGRLVTQEYKVEGPTGLFLTTTSSTVDEELVNRCIVLTVDESPDQTREIHRRQRERRTLAGMTAARRQDRVRRLHQNAQRLLRSLRVVNPWATKLVFPAERTRTRRDHTKYLGLIDTVTLLHQYQRPVRVAEMDGDLVEFIEVTLEDIAAANALAADVLGRCLDELPPQTRNLLVLLDRFVGEACRAEGIDRTEFRFTRRQVREHTGWGDTQLKVHLKRLVDLELVLPHRDRDARRAVYELACIPTETGRALPGLLDVAALRHHERPDEG